MISAYSFFIRNDRVPVYSFPGSYSGSTDTLDIVLAGPGAITVDSAHSVTFQLGVSNMFAYATATLFLEPVDLLQRLLRTGIDALRDLARVASAGAEKPPSEDSITHVAYDRRTGEILKLHGAIAVGDARLPGEAELERISAKLFSSASVASDHVAITSVDADALDGEGHYRIDPKTQRAVRHSP